MEIIQVSCLTDLYHSSTNSSLCCFKTPSANTHYNSRIQPSNSTYTRQNVNPRKELLRRWKRSPRRSTNNEESSPRKRSCNDPRLHASKTNLRTSQCIPRLRQRSNPMCRSQSLLHSFNRGYVTKVMFIDQKTPMT